MRRNAGIGRKLASRAYQSIEMVWAAERMDEHHMSTMVLQAEVSGGRVRRRPRLGWMDGVKVALGNRGMTVKSARQWRKIGKSREPWHIHNRLNFTLPFLLGLVFFRTALSWSSPGE